MVRAFKIGANLPKGGVHYMVYYVLGGWDHLKKSPFIFFVPDTLLENKQ